ncbi:MAG: HD-GYP domain-containing protein [Candidatus Micrarchaeia archaeon]|jgi:response regulator RpfG family c-di-GMP phosphodiesterase
MQDSESSLEEIWKQRKKELPTESKLSENTEHLLGLLKNHCLEAYQHSLRVALLADELATREGMQDAKPAFYGGSLHDCGKLMLPASLLNAPQINNHAYKEIKKHAEYGYKMLAEKHPVCAMIAGSHHRIARGGYGLQPHEAKLPFSLHSKPTIMQAAITVALADYFDAAMTRRKAEGTQIKAEMEHAFNRHAKKIPLLFASDYAHLFYYRGIKH